MENSLKGEKIRTDESSYFTIDSSHIEDYVGMFVLEGTSSELAFCYRGENRFYDIIEGRGQDHFYPISDREFIIPNVNVKLVFLSDENNKMNNIKLDLKGEIVLANRVDFERLSPKELSQNFAGIYYSEALGTVYTVFEKNHQLIMHHRRYEDRAFQQVAMDEFASGYGIMRFKRDEQDNIK